MAFSGKSIPAKLVVFESDDWGSLRVPSKDVYNQLKSFGLSNNPFNQYDCLETQDDLQALFETLNKFHDNRGNPPIFTLDFVVGNPDFNRIKNNCFENYYWESVESSYMRSERSFMNMFIIKQGIANKFIYPQFHGREHLNAFQWIKLLNEGHRQLRKAFDYNVFCIDVGRTLSKRENLMASFDYWNNESKLFLKQHIKEGLIEFSRLFGFRSQSFMAPCNVWDDFVETEMHLQGVEFIQSLRAQKIPLTDSNSYKSKINNIGDRNSNGQIYTVRNVYFEPSTNLQYDWIGNALDKIAAAFFWGKPAIISSHRINYVGGLDEQNRIRGLKFLSLLLQGILERWPDVEFVSSAQLGALYKEKLCVE